MNQLFITLQAQGAGGWETILMIVALFAIMYFMMIRPQQKKQKEMNRFREGLKKGDKVVTAGGIYGVVRQVKELSFIVEIDKNVQIEVDKGSIYPAVTAAPANNKKEDKADNNTSNDEKIEK